MRPWVRNLVLAVSLLSIAPFALAQALPTATQPLNLSAFAGATGADVGLGASQNIGATAGVDLRVGQYFGLRPAVEIRGTYATNGHVVASHKSLVAGVRVGHSFGRITPYIDGLFGRGILDYGGGGYPNQSYTLLYTHTAGNVFSPGAGFDFRLTERVSVKIDGQYQKFSTPVTPKVSGVT